MEIIRPADTAAEKLLIGTCLKFPDDIDDAITLTESDFDSPMCRKCIKVLKEMYHEKQAVDWIEFASKADLKQSEVIKLVNDAISGAMITGLVKKLRDLSKRRAIVEAAGLMIQKAPDETLPVDELLAQAAQYIDESQISETKDPEPLINLIESLVDGYRTGNNIKGIPTGLIDLDELWGGFYPGELTILAARPSMGKTALAQHLALKVAGHTSEPVLIISLEMSEEQLALRYMATELNVDVDSLRRERVSKKYLDERQTALLTKFAQSNLFIHDEPNLTTFDILNLARKLQRNKGLSMIVVDYLTLLNDSKERGEVESLRVASITRRLASMGKKLKVPVLLLAQLNRDCEKRENKRPILNDLKESGGIEERAENVLFLYRGNYYKPDSKDKTLEVIIAKQKQGPRGVTAYVLYEIETGKFLNRSYK